MKKRFLPFLCVVLILILLEQAVYADIPDPGVAIVTGASLVLVTVLGVFALTIAVVSFLVVRGIKKRQLSADDV